MSPFPFQGVVFDVDGVLFDSERLMHRVWKEVGAEMGWPQPGEDYLEFVGNGRSIIYEKMLALYGPDFPKEDFLQGCSQRLQQQMEQNGVPLKPGVRELLDFLRSRNIPMALELDGQVLDGEYLFGAVSNSTSVGGVFTLDASQVDLRDGKFEVILVRMPRDMAELTQCATALQNHTYDCAAITFRSVSSLTVRQDPELVWTLDGERAEGAEELHIENLNRAIRLVQNREEP